jgi:hypothetical protein
MDVLLIACGEHGRVVEALIRDRGRPHAGEQRRHEMGGDMARSHLDEECRAELVHDFEGVVPTHRMRDARREVLAYGFGVIQGATAAIAHIGHRWRLQRELGHGLRQAIRHRLQQRAMRRDADRQTLGTMRAVLPSLGGHRLERRISAGDDDLLGRIDVRNVDGTGGGPDPLHDAFHVDFVEALDGGEAIAAREGRLHQLAPQMDERQGIGKGQRSTGDRRAKGADRHAGDGCGADVFGRQGAGCGHAGDQQRGLDRDGRVQRF